MATSALNQPPNVLPGPAEEEIVASLAAIIGVIVTLTGIGALLDCTGRWPLRTRGHPQAWVLGMIISSYALLVPGLRTTLLSFNIYVHMQVIFWVIGYNVTPEPISESTVSLVHLLRSSGGDVAACFVVLYAMVMPAVKLVLLAFGELWRNSEDPTLRNFACWCVRLVKAVSKWASPDMFAYILLIFLFRNLNHPPIIQSQATLGIGFLCFSVFCVVSTFSTLAIRAPVPIAKVSSPRTPRGQWPTWRLALVVGTLAVLFFVLLGVGVSTPCMALRLDTKAFVEPNGPLPAQYKGMLDSLQLPQMLNADVSVWSCMRALLGWATAGESVFFIAFLLLMVFAVALPALDTALLLAAALHGGRASAPAVADDACATAPPTPATVATSAAAPATQPPMAPGAAANRALAAAEVLRHIAMLDVFCMGLVVVSFAGVAYSAFGFELSLLRGFVPLVCAEVLHTAIFQLVSRALRSDAGAEDAAAVGVQEDTELARLKG
eukprot:TRINITY_DN28692_c0_g1_i1.p1 TRINITY_DN28692_c0_g1~~TRINITY_DN28692_c0_g1_i1.p1  ORF type:complete len:493 (-),score=99.01 TRINITY_DN28692_c0_g1_i1:125-1603(-)